MTRSIYAFGVAMRLFVLFCFLYFNFAESTLWSKGIIHYAINTKDYDLHSQEEIMTVFEMLEKELCIKFFYTPFNYSATNESKILYVSNPEKQKNCPRAYYNYSGPVVEMTVGYHCLNKKEIARIIVDMIRASVEQTMPTINSYDLMKLFAEQGKEEIRSTFLKTEDRNYINAHYHEECSSLTARAPSRRSDDKEEEDGGAMSAKNHNYYDDILWPLGIVMFSIDKDLRDSADYKQLMLAMTQIELASCVVFHETKPSDALAPNNQIVFQKEGVEIPALGLKKGDQIISLKSMTHGAPGHAAHTLNNLLRILGVPMMSNRYDRDNYISVNWQRVKTGRELYLEKMPREAWVESISYDFASATHAPANYLCHDCGPGVTTILPIQDFLWQRVIQMGHKAELSPSDKKVLSVMYLKQCKNRFTPGL